MQNLSTSIDIEAAEMMERFQWLTTEEAQAAVEDPTEQATIDDELADIVIYCLSMSNAVDLDVSSALLAKLEMNETGYSKITVQLTAARAWST